MLREKSALDQIQAEPYIASADPPGRVNLLGKYSGLSMQKHRSDHLIRHSLLLLAASQATNVANFFFHFFMGRMLTPVEYGSLVSMLGLLMFVGIPLGALSNSLAFCSAKLLEEGHAGAIRPFMRRWFGKVMIAGVLIVVLGIVLCPATISFFQLQRPSTFLIAIVVLGLSLFGPVLGGILQGVQAFVWSAVSGIIGTGVRIIVSVALVYWLGRISDWAIIGHGMGVLAGLLIGAGSIIWIFKDTIPVQADKKIAGYFFSSLVILAGFSFMMNADVLIVKHFFSPEESGLFARAATIGRMIIFLPMPIAGALFPKIVAAGGIGGQQKRLLIRGTLLAGAIIVAAAGVGSVIPQLPLWLIYHDVHPSETMIRLVRCMLWAMSPLSLAYIVMNYHMAQSRFNVLFLLPLCALFYLAGVVMWHASVFQIVAVLAASNLAGLTVLLIGLPWRNVKPAESAAPQAVR